MAKVLILEHRVHKDLSDVLLNATVNSIAQRNVECDVIGVPELWDLPIVVRYNIRSMELRVNQNRYMGYVLLGTAPFMNEVPLAYPLTNIYDDIAKVKMQFSVAVGVGIVNTPNKEDALRIAPSIGWEAAVNCFKLLSIKKGLGL